MIQESNIDGVSLFLENSSKQVVGKSNYEKRLDQNQKEMGQINNPEPSDEEIKKMIKESDSGSNDSGE